MRVMHLSSDVREIIIFGIGSTNPIDSICELVYENQELIKIMETFRPEKSILIGGHSEVNKSIMKHRLMHFQIRRYSLILPTVT